MTLHDQVESVKQTSPSQSDKYSDASMEFADDMVIEASNDIHASHPLISRQHGYSNLMAQLKKIRDHIERIGPSFDQEQFYDDCVTLAVYAFRLATEPNTEEGNGKSSR